MADLVKWRIDNIFKADANKCYTEMLDLENITPQAVLERAKDENSEHHIDEKLMSPKKGSPVLVHLNRFSGWSATFTIQYTENAFSIEQIVNIINLAGFGNGIGSGRSSGYGRYHVEGIK